jgi:hypothetical protein
MARSQRIAAEKRGDGRRLSRPAALWQEREVGRAASRRLNA